MSIPLRNLKAVSLIKFCIFKLDIRECSCETRVRNADEIS